MGGKPKGACGFFHDRVNSSYSAKIAQRMGDELNQKEERVTKKANSTDRAKFKLQPTQKKYTPCNSHVDNIF